VKDIDSDNSAKVNKGSKDGPSRQTARRRPVMYVEPSRIHILPRLAGLDQRRTHALRDERPPPGIQQPVRHPLLEVLCV
jgi:hypothetical protein